MVERINSILEKMEAKDISVIGCSGISIVQPNEGWPIVQVPELYQEKCIKLLERLEIVHPYEVVKEKEMLNRLRQAYNTATGNTDKQVEFSKETVNSISELMTPFYDEYISLLYGLKFLDKDCFVYNEREGVLDERVITEKLEMSDNFRRLDKYLEVAGETMLQGEAQELHDLLADCLKEVLLVPEPAGIRSIPYSPELPFSFRAVTLPR